MHSARSKGTGRDARRIGRHEQGEVGERGASKSEDCLDLLDLRLWSFIVTKRGTMLLDYVSPATRQTSQGPFSVCESGSTGKDECWDAAHLLCPVPSSDLEGYVSAPREEETMAGFYEEFAMA